jgi:hypothetical protein
MTAEPSLKMALAYDCFSAGALAVARIQPLCDRLRPKIEFQTALWAFDEVQHLPQQEARATSEMLAADIVIFAAMETTVLPARIRNWVERWAPQKRAHASLLVALVGPACRPLGGFFRQISEFGGMDYFCEPLEPSAREFEFAPSSYDHRVVDGREAVVFLRRVKEINDDPARLLFEM